MSNNIFTHGDSIECIVSKRGRIRPLLPKGITRAVLLIMEPVLRAVCRGVFRSRWTN
jgi:hypothetical protein